MNKRKKNLCQTFFVLLLNITILTSLIAPNFASAEVLSEGYLIENPTITIEYYTSVWEAEPDVKILESTDTSLILEYNNIRTEYYELRNDNKFQKSLL